MFFHVRRKAVPLSNSSWQETELAEVSLGKRWYIIQCICFETAACTSSLYLNVFGDRDSDLLFIGFAEDSEPLK